MSWRKNITFIFENFLILTWKNLYFQLKHSKTIGLGLFIWKLNFLGNLREQIRKAFCYQKVVWPFTVWKNCSNDLEFLANSWPSDSNFKSFSRSMEHFSPQWVRTILVTKCHCPENKISKYEFKVLSLSMGLFEPLETKDNVLPLIHL